MDTDRLRYFITIVQTSSLHRASELLHLSPAALSKAMKLLEIELNTQLFVRSGRGIIVTDAGKLLALRSEKLLKEFESLKSKSEPKNSHGTVLRMGSFEVFSTHFLAPLMEEFSDELDLVLHELPPGRLEESILNEEIDVGLTYIPIPQAGLDYLKVCNIQMNVFLKKGAFPKMAWEQIPFAVPVTPIHGSPTKVVGLDGWPDNLYTRNTRFKVTLMESALELCRQGLAATYLPEFVVKLHNAKQRENFQLVTYAHVLPLSKAYTVQPVYLIKRKSQLESGLIKRIAKVLRVVVASQH